MKQGTEGNGGRASRLLGALVRLFPRDFRERFGDEVLRTLLAAHRAGSASGVRGRIAFWLRNVPDLILGAVRERIDVGRRRAKRGGSSERQEARETMNGWLRDLRHAVRALRRSPGFMVISVGTLGVAIGANAGVFSVVDTVLLDPLPFPHADRLVHIAASAPGSDMPDEFGVSAEFFVHYSERSQLLEDVSTYGSGTSTLRVGDRTERVRMSWPTTSLFSTLEATPILGRLPVPEDEDRVAVISHALWTTWFGSDPSVIGRSYAMDGSNRTVIGVMGPDFWFPRDDVLLWIPQVIRADEIVPGRFGGDIEGLVARMAPVADSAAVASELEQLARELPERFGGSANYARLIERHQPVVRSMRAELLGDVSRPLWILLGSAGVLLLIACANVANLFALRAERRQRDLAIRRAIGAGRGRLLRSEMAEVIVVAVLAGALAVTLAWVSVPLLIGVRMLHESGMQSLTSEIPRLGDVSVTPRTLAFAVVASLLCVFLCGLVPALRSSSPNLASVRDGGRGSTRRRHRARDGLVALQTALALVLVIGSGLLLRSFQEIRNVDPGYDTEDIFTFQIAPEGSDLPDAPSYARFHTNFMERVAALPGVESVGVVNNVPLNEGVSGARVRTDETAGDPEGGTLVGVTRAGGDYFATMGIDVLGGRAFTSADHISSLGNVVISRSAANLLWPGEDPVGRRIQVADFEGLETVVGVVEDVLQDNFRDEPQPLIYFPMLVRSVPWSLASPAYVVKTRRAENIASEVRALVREVRPEAPMYRVFTMAGLAAGSMVELRFTMLMLGIASMLALFLGAVGLYGVLSYVVADRRQEIGVRMALGAEGRRVRRMVVVQGTRVVIVGVLIGTAVAIWTTRALEGLLFNVGALDAATFLTMAVTMILIGLLASYVPARRASSVDPIESLRAE